MNLSATAGQFWAQIAAQIEPGVRLVDVAPRPGFERWRGLAQKVRFRTNQLILNLALQRAVKLWVSDRPAAERLIASWRTMLLKPTPQHVAMTDANAVRIAPPHAPNFAPPAPSERFAPHKGEPRGFVFYVHGGSFCLERSPRLTAMVARFAARANARVFAPSYRLAPEHPCPAGVEDILSAWRWFKASWPDEPVVVLADSAGAAVALAALQMARDEGEDLPDGVVLLSPWADLSLQSWSVVAASLGGSSGATMESLALMAHLYLQGRPATDPVASPLFGDFSGFPPMLIHASKGDILYDDAVRLADRLRDVGGDLTVRLWAAETHVWETKDSATARQSIDLAADFIERCLD